MLKLLLTAFEPYGTYGTNVSFETLSAVRERIRGTRTEQRLRTATFPVDFSSIAERLDGALADDVGAVVLMGQAPGRATIDLERFALNAGVEPGADAWFPLEPAGPPAMRSDLPLDEWSRALASRGIPAAHSFHAGTYLCNAATYHALRRFEGRGQPLAATFLHLPLAKELFPGEPKTLPLESLVEAAEAVIELAVEWLDAEEPQSRESSIA